MNDTKAKYKKEKSLTHADVIRISMKIGEDKAKIEKAILAGTPMNEMARQYGCGISSFQSACEVYNIALPTRGGDRRKMAPQLIDALIIVVERIASQLGVDYSELRPYIGQENKEGDQ